VSPLWRDEIGVHLSPHRVCLVRVARGIRPALAAEHEQEVESETAGHWAGPLAALDGLLAESQWQGATLRVVLADCWARYAIVPWAADLSSSQERLSHARQLLASTYGDAVSGWDVRLSDAPPQSSRIACTLPVELLEGVRGVCSKHGTKLATLQPQLVVAYENWRRHLPASGGWFVTVGAGTLAAARVARHTWDRVHNVRIGSDWARDLKRLQTFGRLASASADEGQVYVDAPQAWREVAGTAGRDLHWLEDDAGSLSTLQRLGRVQRLAA
jgi:hypothetical protein